MSIQSFMPLFMEKRNIIIVAAMFVAIMARAQSCPDNNHPHAIDLGLPSGTKWACCNVGTDQPIGLGDYYSYAETETKEVYNWRTCKLSDDGTSYGVMTYFPKGFNKTDVDVSTVKWGEPWETPMIEQFQELFDNCTAQWTTVKGVNGRLFTGKNGNSIFMPAAGQKIDFSLSAKGKYGYYWTSDEQPEGKLRQARFMFFYDGNQQTSGVSAITIGRSIRPIIKK